MSEHDEATCECARCIRRRVWGILMQSEEMCRRIMYANRERLARASRPTDKENET